jgi:DNA-binding transcriptional MerR regulator
MDSPVPGQAADAAGPRAGPRSAKSAAAFRTISEVADELDVAQHVLRFWESKFPQVRPLKRGGGRRYYRPEDVDLLRQIRSLLYDEGYTIKGVQKLLKAPRRSGDEAAGSRAPAAAAKPARPAAPPQPAPAVVAAGAERPPALSQDLRSQLRRLRDDLVALRVALNKALG